MVKKLETFGSKKWWPLRVLEKQGKGGRETKEVYRNMATGDIHYPTDNEGMDKGWSGSPPNAEGGCKDLPDTNSQKYREGYEKIRWDEK